MSCCSADGASKYFSKHARRYAKTFRKKGLDRASMLIVEAIAQLPVQGRSVLEVGCGVGGLHLTLLKSGAASAFGVEASEGMIDIARGLAQEMGFSDKVQYLVGDFAAANGTVPPADIVVLDKVLCCSDNAEALIQKSAGRAGSLYAVSYPRDAFLARVMFKSSAWVGSLLKWSFHPYYHEPSTIERCIRGQGFEEVFSRHTPVWQIKAYRRGDKPGA